jgi:prepilin-type N-terminal cleavage/methylation domain-containing protein
MSFSTQKGITLIELIVAVSVLSFALAGPMTLAASSLRATQDARNELIATHLAEEGLEVLHNIRDNNSSNDLTPGPGYTGWQNHRIDFVTPCANLGCIVDVTAHATLPWGVGAIVACTNTDCVGENILYYNPTTGLYRQSLGALGGDWQASLFTRTVHVVVISATREIQVTSTVTFRSITGATRSITVSEVFYNWFPPLQ